MAVGNSRSNGGIRMSVTVRHADLTEAVKVSQLAARTFPAACPPDMSREDQQAYISTHLTPEHFTAFLSDPDTAVLVADSDGDLVGYVLLLFGSDGQPQPDMGVTAQPTGLLSKCYLDDAIRGTGVAHLLITAGMDEGYRRGCEGIWLNVNYLNMRAQKFYEKHGWQRVGYVDFPVGGVMNHDPVYQYIYGPHYAPSNQLGNE